MPTILRRKDSGPDFKRDFVVYIVSTLMKGLQDRHANFKIPLALVDIDKIKEYNWCLHTLESLTSTVLKWRKNLILFLLVELLFRW